MVITCGCSSFQSDNITLLYGKISENRVFKNGEILLIKDSVVFNNCSVEIESGVIFRFEHNAKMVFHNCTVKSKSTSNKSILFEPTKKIDFWDRLYVYNSTIIISNAIFNDGLISLYNSTFELDSLKITTHNDRINFFEFPFVYVIKSSGIIQNSILKNPVKSWTGEGIVVEDGSVAAINNTIEFIPDAIEFTRVEDGKIYGNNIVSSLDDAIDLNACRNVDVSNNTILSSKDKGISIGGDQKFLDKLHPNKWGPSIGITVSNNRIKNCKIGIAIKDSSEVFLEKNILSNNKIETQFVESTITYKAN